MEGQVVMSAQNVLLHDAGYTECTAREVWSPRPESTTVKGTHLPSVSFTGKGLTLVLSLWMCFCVHPGGAQTQNMKTGYDLCS
jgi:hypothetical protein